MAITTGQVVVNNIAGALNLVDSDTVSGTRITVKNTHATDALVLGDSAVTPSTGFSLAAGQTLPFTLAAGERLYGVRAGANDITAHVLRSGV